MLTRRRFATLGAAAAAGTVTFLPFARRAAAQTGGDTYETDGGQITIHPVDHASFVMETPAGTIYADPVGDAGMYADYPAPDLILVTHEHGDHYNAETLAALMGEGTALIVNPAVLDMLPEDLKARATALANGERAEVLGITVDAVPAYNTTEDRLQYHPKGRDNGYILAIDGSTVYIAGDTEDTEEVRALTGIDIAFLPMNLPYTMTVEQAAAAVQAFQPSFVYPYHYRDSDPEAFAALVAEQTPQTQVVMGPWYD